MQLTIRKFLLLSLMSAVSLNVYAEWQCYVGDQGGHYWTSTGSTQELANAVATNFCTAYSPNGDTCQTNKCFEK